MDKEIKIKYKPLPKQALFHKSKARVKTFIGGIGSGKTVALCAEGLREALRQPNSLGLLGAPSYKMCKDVVWETFLNICPQELIAEIKMFDFKIDLINGSSILFRSFDQPDKIRGLNLAWAGVDELPLITHRGWQILKGRIRQVGFIHKMFGAGTPNGLNWVQKEFILDNKHNYELINASTRENIYLDEEYIQELESSYTGVFKLQELEGKFVAHEGLIYPEFKRNIHVKKINKKIKDFKEIIAGVDFGWTNPCALLIIGIDGDDNYYVLKEFYERRVLFDKFKQIIEQESKIYNINVIYCDPSEPNYIEELKYLNAQKANNAFLPGINAVKSKLVIKENGQPSLFIDESCINLIKELNNYQYMKDKDGNSLSKPLKVMDHLNDCARYAIFSHKKKVYMGTSEFALDGVHSDNLFNEPKIENKIKVENSEKEPDKEGPDKDIDFIIV